MSKIVNARVTAPARGAASVAAEMGGLGALSGFGSGGGAALARLCFGLFVGEERSRARSISTGLAAARSGFFVESRGSEGRARPSARLRRVDGRVTIDALRSSGGQ